MENQSKAGMRFTWLTALRGLAAILFGIVVLAEPGAGMVMLLVIFGIYAGIDGVLSIGLSIREGRAGGRWGFWLFEGLVGIALAALAFAQPFLTLAALVWLVAIRAILMGMFAVGAAISLRAIENRWLLGLMGGASSLFGLLLFAISPAQGALALLWLIGVYAIVVGVMLVVIAIGSAIEKERLAPLQPQRST
jgi:uncharacterized membrane protein HdeD (DUF308 family)